MLSRLLSFEEYLALAIEVRQEYEELLGVEEVARITSRMRLSDL
jgi:hypothetical protein